MLFLEMFGFVFGLTNVVLDNIGIERVVDGI